MSRPEYDALVDAVARKMAEILTDNGLPVSSPDEGDLDDVAAFWRRQILE